MAVGALVAALAAMAGIGSASPQRGPDTKLSLVAYANPTRERVFAA